MLMRSMMLAALSCAERIDERPCAGIHPRRRRPRSALSTEVENSREDAAGLPPATRWRASPWRRRCAAPPWRPCASAPGRLPARPGSAAGWRRARCRCGSASAVVVSHRLGAPSRVRPARRASDPGSTSVAGLRELLVILAHRERCLAQLLGRIDAGAPAPPAQRRAAASRQDLHLHLLAARAASRLLDQRAQHRRARAPAAPRARRASLRHVAEQRAIPRSSAICSSPSAARRGLVR